MTWVLLVLAINAEHTVVTVTPIHGYTTEQKCIQAGLPAYATDQPPDAYRITFKCIPGPN
jgi:hypothetical protein